MLRRYCASGLSHGERRGRQKMITQEKIGIYIRYDGDIDGFVRVGSAKEKEIMNDNDFFEIQNLIQDIILMRRNLSSKQYTENTRKKLAENSIDPETVELLYNKFKK
jgi:hypothetical protein